VTLDPTENIAALLGSRICHDLISPIGAISNGLELLSLSGVADDGPEIRLIGDSADSATGRIGLFRLAFGMASPSQSTRHDEICKVWSTAMADRRLDLNWLGSDSLPRPLAQCVVLALLCLEKALPQGGELSVASDDDRWVISASSPTMKQETALWDMLSGQGLAKIDPAHVQFLLLPQNLAQLGRQCQVNMTDEKLTLAF